MVSPSDDPWNDTLASWEAYLQDLLALIRRQHQYDPAFNSASRTLQPWNSNNPCAVAAIQGAYPKRQQPQ